jgi:hypothetical protein
MNLLLTHSKPRFATGKKGNHVMILYTQLDGERGQVNAKRTKNLRAIRTLIPITSLLFRSRSPSRKHPQRDQNSKSRPSEEIFQGVAHGWYHRWEDDLRQPTSR